MKGKKLEDMWDIKKGDINLGRIARITCGYGLVGTFFSERVIIAPLIAGVGLLSSIYDEINKTGMNLVYPAASIFVGGLIGSFLDINPNEIGASHILCYGGAAIGGLLGFYKSYLTKEKFL